MKRIISLFLLLATLLMTLAACAEGDTSQQNTDTTAAEESTEPAQLDAIPEDLKYNGEEIVILSRAKQGWTQDEIAVPELNSEPVNDAIFNRNITVFDRLNVSIVSAPIEDPDEYKPITEIESIVKAGSSDYDLVASACYTTMPSVLKGTFYDLTELEYLDLSRDYWMQSYNELISYGQSQYTATGMIALSTYRFAFVTMFNKNLFDNKNVPYLYDAVSSSEWTLDYQASLAADFYQDLNGNGRHDEADLFGFISCPGLSTDPYWSSCNMPILEKNDAGEYVWVLDVGHVSDVVDKLLILFYDCGGTYLYKEEASNTEQDEIRRMFAEGHSAMTTLRLIAVEQPDVRDMEQMYGIVPMPKFDEAQEDYGTLMHDQFTVFCVPVSAAKEKLEMIGATLEVMASESQRTVKPAYYEIALKRKYMSDPIAWEMLDLTFDRMITDAGVVYGLSLDFPHHMLRTIVNGKKNNASSKFASVAKSCKRSLVKLQAKLEKLEE